MGDACAVSSRRVRCATDIERCGADSGVLNGVFCTSRERAASEGGPLGYLTEKYRHDEVVFA